MTDASIAQDDGLMTDPGLPNGTALSEGQFVITRRLSAGGFGITYLAEDTTLGRTIVIKECFPEDICTRNGTKVRARTSAQSGVLKSISDMFMREARSLAQLRHTNIVGVHCAFEENGTAYMALDLIDGFDLYELIEDEVGTPPSPSRIKEILLELLGAVETIHSHDLLHRDISPDNIIIENTGRPVLIDFGAARAEASRKTRAVSSMILVKDGYSPQEFYVAGSLQTPSSDLYALAATFYHMITGKAPTNSQIRMAEMVSDNPDPCVPLAGRFDSFEPEFLAAIDKAMAVVPRNRLQTAAEWRALISDQAGVSNDISPRISEAPAKPVTRDVEKMLTRMIRETNELVKNEPEVVKEKTAPVKAVTSREEVTRIEWLREFNAETAMEDDVVAEDDVEAVADLAAKSVDANFDETCPEPELETVAYVAEPAVREPTQNWAARVMEKKQLAEAHLVRESTSYGDINGGSLQSRQDHDADLDGAGAFASKPHTLENLAKYLLTGIVLGLASLMVLPNFF